MKKIDQKWPGHLGELMKKHMDMRRAIGRVGTADAYTLYNFNNFLIENYPKIKVPNRMAILHYMKTYSHLSVGGRRNKLIYIRQFCLFLNQRGIECYVPDKTLIPKYTYEPRYYPLNEKQIIQIMNLIENYKNHHNKKYTGRMYSTFIGLLWATGLRSGEACRLKHEDIDLEEGLILVKQTKFFKDRIIPISKTSIEALKDHLSLKESLGLNTSSDSSFFLNSQGRPLSAHTVGSMFGRFVRRMKIKKINGRYPVLHDLRHNFATQWIHRFYKDTAKYPPQSYVPKLSTYLGHTTLFSSQYYIHPDFDLLQSASKNFNLEDLYEK